MSSDSIIGTPYIGMNVLHVLFFLWCTVCVSWCLHSSPALRCVDLDLLKVRSGKPCKLSDYVGKGIPVVLMLYSCWGDEDVIFALERAEENAKKVGKKNAVCPSVLITFRISTCKVRSPHHSGFYLSQLRRISVRRIASPLACAAEDSTKEKKG